MQRININKTKNPVMRKYYQQGKEEGISQSVRYFQSIFKLFAEKDGIGEATLNKLHEAIEERKKRDE